MEPELPLELVEPPVADDPELDEDFDAAPEEVVLEEVEPAEVVLEEVARDEAALEVDVL